MNKDATKPIVAPDVPPRVHHLAELNWQIAIIAVVVGAVVLFAAPVWIVNFDGTSYLALAANLRDFNGFVAPDGSAMTLRGPGYPALLSIGWLFGGYASGLAMAMSRVALIVGGVVAAQFVFTLTRSRIAAVVGIGLFFSQPILYQAGVWQLFPDGLAAVTVVAAIALVFFAHERTSQTAFYVAAGLLASLAFITKESHVLVMAGVVLWVFTLAQPMSDRLRRIGELGLGFSIVFVPWALFGLHVSGALPGAMPHVRGAGGVAVAIAAVAVPVGLLLVSRMPIKSTVRLPTWVAAASAFLLVLTAAWGSTRWLSQLPEVPGAIAELVRVEAYPSWWLIGAIAVVGLAIGALVLLPRGAGSDLLIISTVSACGLLVFAAQSGTALRNAAVLAVLLAVVGATVVTSTADRPRMRVVAGGLVLVAVVFGIGGIVEQSRSLDVDRLTAEAEPAVDAARWLVEHAAGEQTAGTPTASQSVWRMGTRNAAVSMVPMYLKVRETWASGDDRFSHVYGWLGQPSAPERSGDAAAYSVIGSQVSAIFREDITNVLDGNRYIVITGNTRYPASPADGGFLALVLANAGAVEPVFVSHYESAQWVAIVEAQSGASIGPADPLVRYSGSAQDDIPDGAFDLVEYSTAVAELLDMWGSRVDAQEMTLLSP